MLKRSAVLAAMLMALLAAPVPVMAQDAEALSGGTADGKFRLTLDGWAPENVSFWVETSSGAGGVICTTDAAMVETGIPECRDGGSTNEMAFSAPAGSTLDYRIIGSQGSELSQEVVAEGSKVADTGFIVDASYTFSGDTIGGDPAGTHPDGNASADNNDDGAASGQYEDDSSSDGGPSSENVDSNAAVSVLPDTGGASVAVIAGAALLLAAGGFLAYRTIS
ncbi:MAG TPA: LPXTG cell wall anchor domain-containing protein [Rubrobacteraceae bacterium]|nr:LPXTG cell wall anchor domain-containing protein [Rubrobacteraceae bacterium]